MLLVAAVTRYVYADLPQEWYLTLSTSAPSRPPSDGEGAPGAAVHWYNGFGSFLTPLLTGDLSLSDVFPEDFSFLTFLLASSVQALSYLAIMTLEWSLQAFAMLKTVDRNKMNKNRIRRLQREMNSDEVLEIRQIGSMNLLLPLLGAGSDICQSIQVPYLMQPLLGREGQSSSSDPQNVPEEAAAFIPVDGRRQEQCGEHHCGEEEFGRHYSCTGAGDEELLSGRDRCSDNHAGPRGTPYSAPTTPRFVFDWPLACAVPLLLTYFCVPFRDFILSCLPRFITGGLLVDVAVEICRGWIYHSRARIAANEWIVLVLNALLVLYDLTTGLGIGLSAALCLFVYEYAGVSGVVGEASGETLPKSNTDRSSREVRLLKRGRGDVHVLWLQGYLFFGSVLTLVARVRALAGMDGSCETPTMLGGGPPTRVVSGVHDTSRCPTPARTPKRSRSNSKDDHDGDVLITTRRTSFVPPSRTNIISVVREGGTNDVRDGGGGPLRSIILDFSFVPAMDANGVFSIVELATELWREKNIKLIVCGLVRRLANALQHADNSGGPEECDHLEFAPDLDQALQRTEESCLRRETVVLCGGHEAVGKSSRAAGFLPASTCRRDAAVRLGVDEIIREGASSEGGGVDSPLLLHAEDINEAEGSESRVGAEAPPVLFRSGSMLDALFPRCWKGGGPPPAAAKINLPVESVHPDYRTFWQTMILRETGHHGPPLLDLPRASAAEDFWLPQITALARISSHRVLSKGDILFSPDERVREILFLVHGDVSLYTGFLQHHVLLPRYHLNEKKGDKFSFEQRRRLRLAKPGAVFGAAGFVLADTPDYLSLPAHSCYDSQKTQLLWAAQGVCTSAEGAVLVVIQLNDLVREGRRCVQLALLLRTWLGRVCCLGAEETCLDEVGEVCSGASSPLGSPERTRGAGVYKKTGGGLSIAGTPARIGGGRGKSNLDLLA